MKNLRVIFCLVIGLSFSACGSLATATQPPEPSTIPSTTGEFQTTPASNGLTTRQTERVATVFALQTASATQLPTLTHSQTPTPAPTSTPIPVFGHPTLIPAIDRTLLPGLLKTAFSIETDEGINGHNIRKITGWDYGFGANIWYANCPSHVWLDTNHLLLYPGAGQEYPPEGMGTSGINIIHQPVVINLETGSVWLPPVDVSSGRTCNRVFWSRDLGVVINAGIYEGTPAVFTHTFDGKKLDTYRGNLTEVSPSSEKILIDNNTLIDLRTNSRTTLAWSLEGYEEQILSEVFWTSDETRLYRCCYFYADLITKTSHRFGTSDFQDKNGNYFDYSGLWMYRGQWVRNNTYFLVWWSYVDDGDIRYLPMFDPAEKIFYDVREEAGISPDLICPETDLARNRQYLWIMCYEINYFVDLSNFETTTYPGYTQVDINWSNDSQFAWLADYYTSEGKIEILSVADKEIKPLPIAALSGSVMLWHPTDNVLVYPAKDKDTLIFLDVSTMTYRELPFILAKPPHHSNSDLAWSPNGEKIALIAEYSSLWQVGYPELENLKQLTQPIPDMRDVNWSPTGNSIAFTSGSDIFIVDAAP